MGKSPPTSNSAINLIQKNLLQPNKSGSNFDNAFLDAVDEALSSLLGDSGKQTLYFHLKTFFNLEKHDIPHKIEEFAQAIEDIFGYGAKLIGGFKVFKSFELKPPERHEPFQPPPDLPGKYSMGSKDMDDVVGGGIPEGSFIILECDEKVPIAAVPVLLHPMTASFVLRGRGVIIAPSSGVNYALLSEFLKLYGVTPEHCKRSFRLVIMGKTMETAESCKYEIAVDGGDWKKDLETILKKYEQFISEAGHPVLSMVYAATLATLYGDKRCLEILKTTVAQAKNAGAILIAIIGAGYRDLAIKLSLLADFYFRLTRKHGCPILYGVKPRTLLYAVEADMSKGYPTAKLAPIL